MQKLALTFAVLIAAVGLVSFQGYQQNTVKNYCNSTQARKAAKQALDPFQYDAGKTNTFTFKDKIQKREIEVPLFVGEKYRFAFNTSGLPQPIDIEIYDKKEDSKNRTLLFSNEGEEGDMLTYEPLKSKKVFVNYTVPATNDTIKKGCVVMVVGYKSRFKK